MIFDDEGPTVTDRLLDPLRRTMTGTALFGEAIRRQSMRERDSLLAGLSLPDAPENLKRFATWAGIAITVGSILYYAHRFSKKGRKGP